MIGGWLVGRQADVDERISKPHERRVAMMSLMGC